MAVDTDVRATDLKACWYLEWLIGVAGMAIFAKGCWNCNSTAHLLAKL